MAMWKCSNLKLMLYTQYMSKSSGCALVVGCGLKMYGKLVKTINDIKLVMCSLDGK